MDKETIHLCLLKTDPAYQQVQRDVPLHPEKTYCAFSTKITLLNHHHLTFQNVKARKTNQYLQDF